MTSFPASKKLRPGKHLFEACRHIIILLNGYFGVSDLGDSGASAYFVPQGYRVLVTSWRKDFTATVCITLTNMTSFSMVIAGWLAIARALRSCKDSTGSIPQMSGVKRYYLEPRPWSQEVRLLLSSLQGHRRCKSYKLIITLL